MGWIEINGICYGDPQPCLPYVRSAPDGPAMREALARIEAETFRIVTEAVAARADRARRRVGIGQQPLKGSGNMSEERLALVYSDGSLGVLCEGTTSEKAFKEAMGADLNETDPTHFTKVAWVRYTIVKDLGHAHQDTTSATCSVCGKTSTPMGAS